MLSKKTYSKKYFEFYAPEKLPFTIDIDKLIEHLNKVVLPIGHPIYQSDSKFGGWSVLSSNGDWKDGWQQGHKIFVKGETLTKDEMKVFLEPENFVKPTQICTGYLAEIINKINDLGFEPRRARISIVGPKGYSSQHRDSSDHLYSARIHIPIITYPECEHIMWDREGNEYRHHLKADGSAYMIWVNHMHQVVNPTDKPRYHLIMNAHDTKFITKNFKYI